MNQGKRFDGKHVVVTGAGRGIGYEIARQFLLHGARVYIFEVDNDLLQTALSQLRSTGALVEGTQVDVSNGTAVRAAVADVEAIAPIDVLINNAGIAFEMPFLELPESQWRQVLDVNLTGFFLVAQAVCQQMARRRRGVVVNMASKNGLAGEVGYSHYNSSKAGVIMLTKTMALELAPLGIRVNAVCPGYIQTPMSEAIDSPEFVRDFIDQYIPLGRAGRVEDVASLFLFLAGDESRFVTGECLLADGGQLAGQKPAASLAERMIASAKNL